MSQGIPRLISNIRVRDLVSRTDIEFQIASDISGSDDGITYRYPPRYRQPIPSSRRASPSPIIHPFQVDHVCLDTRKEICLVFQEKKRVLKSFYRGIILFLPPIACLNRIVLFSWGKFQYLNEQKTIMYLSRSNAKS